MHAEKTGLAETVRRLRHQHQWTLDHAAARLGISRRLVAQIEGGDANPSLSTLLAIANGFGIHLTQLLGQTQPSPSITTRHDPLQAPELWSTPHGSSGRLLVGRGPLELWSFSLAPGDQRTSEAHHPDSTEALHVAAGTIEIELGDQRQLLRAGASAIFSTGTSHAYRNPSEHNAEFLLAVFDPA